MDGVAENRRSDELLMVAARELKAFQHRLFLGRFGRDLCDESPRKSEARLGWGRETVAKRLRELKSQKPELNDATNSVRGRPRIEHKNPQLAIDIRLIVEPHTFRSGLPAQANSERQTIEEDQRHQRDL